MNDKKVVEGYDILFKDDFSIAEGEISRKLPLPKPYMLSLDEMIMVYNDSLLKLSENIGADYMRFYKTNYGIESVGQIKDLEAKYFADNAVKIAEAKKDFIDNCVCVSPDLKDKVPNLGKQLGSALSKMIEKQYPKLASADKSASAFANLGYGNFMLTDNKMYKLITMPDLIGKYRGFEPNFFKELKAFAAKATPEEVSKMLVKNKDSAHEKVWPVVRDNIWCNDRSMKIFLGGAYLIPDYVGTADKMGDNYMNMLEGKVKLNAAEDLQKGVLA